MKKDNITYLIADAMAVESMRDSIKHITGIEVISMETANLMKLQAERTREAIPIVAPIIWEPPFKPPMTRSERRKQQRNKRK